MMKCTIMIGACHAAVPALTTAVLLLCDYKGYMPYTHQKQSHAYMALSYVPLLLASGVPEQCQRNEDQAAKHNECAL